MINQIIVSGNLVNDVQSASNGDKIYAYGKIGVYNGKDKEGNVRESMFFDFITFGKDADFIRELGKKGKSITLIGRLEEDKSEKDGRTYINKRVVCTNILVNEKPVKVTVNEVADPFVR